MRIGALALRVDFDRRLMLEFHGSDISSDAGWLLYGELDDALGLTELGGDPPVTVTSVLSRQFDHVSNQQVFVRPSSG